jgi:hypothetical protein
MLRYLRYLFLPRVALVLLFLALANRASVRCGCCPRRWRRLTGLRLADGCRCSWSS